MIDETKQEINDLSLRNVSDIITAFLLLFLILHNLR